MRRESDRQRDRQTDRQTEGRRLIAELVMAKMQTMCKPVQHDLRVSERERERVREREVGGDGEEKGRE